MSLRVRSKWDVEHLQSWGRVRRKWQNPFYLESWNDFWVYVAIDQLMSLYDRPQPSLILYSADLLVEERERVMKEAEKILEDKLKERK